MSIDVRSGGWQHTFRIPVAGVLALTLVLAVYIAMEEFSKLPSLRAFAIFPEQFGFWWMA
jgi:hypothetical protein